MAGIDIALNYCDNNRTVRVHTSILILVSNIFEICGAFIKATVFLLIIYSSKISAATLFHEQISTDSIQFTLENEVPLEIAQAQAAIYPHAVRLCEGKYPSFGKYSFDSSESISSLESNSKGSQPSSFSFIQNIKCVENSPEAQMIKPITISKKQEESIKSKVVNLTNQYLLAKEAGKFEEAYDKLGSGMKSITSYSIWKKRESTYFFEKLGSLKTREIWNATVYINPPNSPQTGIYVAIDYENSYEISPIHCGYVVWYMPTADSVEISITREEYGTIPENNVLNSTPEQLQILREKMGCRVL